MFLENEHLKVRATKLWKWCRKLFLSKINSEPSHDLTESRKNLLNTFISVRTENVRVEMIKIEYSCLM